MFDMTGKVALVTGASQGLGKEIAVTLAKAGADVVICARTKEKLEQVQKEIELLGRKAYVIPVDLTDIRQLDTMVQQAVEQAGKIDILVNNAGINIRKRAFELQEEDWDAMMDLNLKSLFFCCQKVGKHMAERKFGRIINMSSQMAVVGYYDRAGYCASKGGVSQLTKVLAIEWAPYNITVNAVGPTFVETPLTIPMFQNEEFKKDVISRIPLGKLPEPVDVAYAVLYLASDAARFVTGHTLLVDGGWTAW